MKSILQVVQEKEIEQITRIKDATATAEKLISEAREKANAFADHQSSLSESAAAFLFHKRLEETEADLKKMREQAADREKEMKRLASTRMPQVARFITTVVLATNPLVEMEKEPVC